MGEQRHIISHPDGRQYSVTRAGFNAVYKAQGFTIDHPETPGDFELVGVPAPKRPRSSPRPKKARATKPTPAQPMAVPRETSTEG